MKNNPLFSGRVSILMGKSNQATFSASPIISEIKIYNNRIVLSIKGLNNFLVRFFFTNYYSFYPFKSNEFKSNEIPMEINLNYNDIIGYKLKKIFLISLQGYRIRLIHKNKNYPKFLEIWPKIYTNEVIDYLKIHNIKEIKNK